MAIHSDSPNNIYIIHRYTFLIHQTLDFPNLLDYKLLGIGILFFIMGWIIDKFGLSN